MNGSDGQKLYTVAEFMSTKFGSMKNRGQRARALAQQQQQQQAAQQQQMQQQQQAQQQAQQQLFQQRYLTSHILVLQNAPLENIFVDLWIPVTLITPKFITFGVC